MPQQSDSPLNEISPHLAADMSSQEYGVLKYSVGELIASGNSVISSVQDYLGAIVSDVHNSAARSHSSRAGQDISKDEFFKHFPEAFSQVSSQPVDLSFLTRSHTPQGTIGSLYPDLTKARTVGDVQKFLANSVTPGLLASSKEFALSKGQDFMPVFQASFTGYLENAWKYKPSTDNGGQSYVSYAMKQGFFGSDRYSEAETTYSSVKGYSLEATMEMNPHADEGATGMPEGTFTERPFAPGTPLGRMFSLYPENRNPRTSSGAFYAPQAQPGSAAAMAGIERGTPIDAFSYLTRQEWFDLADQAESGAPFTIQVGNRSVSLQGDWNPQPEMNREVPFWEGIQKKMAPDGAYNTGLFSWNGQSVANGRAASVFTAKEIKQMRSSVSEAEWLQSGANYQPVFMDRDQLGVWGKLYSGSENDPSLSMDDMRSIGLMREAVTAIEPQLKGVGTPDGSGDRGRFPVGEAYTPEDFDSVYNGSVHDTSSGTGENPGTGRPHYTHEEFNKIFGGAAHVDTPEEASASASRYVPPSSPEEAKVEQDRSLFPGVGRVWNATTKKNSTLSQSDEWLTDPTLHSDDVGAGPVSTRAVNIAAGSMGPARARLLGNGGGVPALATMGIASHAALNSVFSEPDPVARNSPRQAVPGYALQKRRWTNSSAVVSARSARNGVEGVNYSSSDEIIQLRSDYDHSQNVLNPIDLNAPERFSSNAEKTVQDLAYNAALDMIRSDDLGARVASRGVLKGWTDFNAAEVVTPAEDAVSKDIRSNAIGGGWKRTKDGYEPRYNPRTVGGDEHELNQLLSDIGNKDPNAAARIRFGTDEEGFGTTVNQILENNSMPFRYQAGKEAEFGAEYDEYSKDNPMEAGYLKSLFPSKAQQLSKARVASKRMGIGASATAPQQSFDHNNPAPEGTINGLPWEMTQEEWQTAVPGGSAAQYHSMIAGAIAGGRNIPPNVMTALSGPASAPSTGHAANLPGGGRAQPRMAMNQGDNNFFGGGTDPITGGDRRSNRTSSDVGNAPVSARAANPAGGGNNGNTPPPPPPPPVGFWDDEEPSVPFEEPPDPYGSVPPGGGTPPADTTSNAGGPNPHGRSRSGANRNREEGTTANRHRVDGAPQSGRTRPAAEHEATVTANRGLPGWMASRVTGRAAAGMPVSNNEAGLRFGGTLFGTGIFSQWADRKSRANPRQNAPQFGEFATEALGLWNDISQMDIGAGEDAVRAKILQTFPELEGNDEAIEKLLGDYSAGRNVNIPGSRSFLRQNSMVGEMTSGTHNATPQTARNQAYANSYMASVGKTISSGIDVHSVGGMSNQYGSGDRKSGTFVDKDGNETVSLPDVTRAVGMTQRAIESATSTPLSKNINEAVAELKERVASIVTADTKQLAKDLEKVDGSSVAAKDHATKIRAVTDDLAKEAVKNVVANLEGLRGETADKGAASDLKTYANRINSPKTAAELAQHKPDIAARLAEEHNGMTPEQAAMLPSSQAIVMEDKDGQSYTFGGGGEGYQKNDRGGLWRGKIGSAMYGMYMISREWKMAMGQSIQDATMFGNYASEGFNPSLFGNGDRNAALSTEAGFATRQAEGQRYMGRGAYEQFGAFMDIPYMLSGGNGASARLAAGTSAGLGIGVGGSMALNMLETMGVAGAGALAPTAATVGAAMVVGTLGMEAYNAIAKPEVPATASNIFKWAINSANVASAKKAYKDERIGDNIGSMTMDQVTAIEKEADKVENFAPYMNLQARIAGGYGYDGSDAGNIQAAMKKFSAAGVSDTDALKAISTFQMGYNRSPRESDITALTDWAGKLGMTVDSAQQAEMSYASQLGFLPGTSGYKGATDRYRSNASDPAKMAREDMRSGRIAGMGSQLQALMPLTDDFQGFGARLVGGYNMSPGQVSNTQSLIQSVQQGGATNMTQAQYGQMAAAGSSMTGYQASQIGNMSTQVGLAGGNSISFVTNMSGMGMNNQDLGLMGKIAGGDLGAASYASYQTGDMSMRLFDQSGAPIQNTNGGSFAQTAMMWANGNPFAKNSLEVAGGNRASAGNPYAARMPYLTSLAGAKTPDEFYKKMGMTDQKTINALVNGGFEAVQLMQNQNAYDNQMKSIGLQGAGVALTQQFYWGSKDGGTYDNPASGSMWNLEDRMISVQNRAQAGDFAYQKQSMEMSNRYGIARENNQFERMTTSQSYNTWQMNDNRSSQLQQRGWTQEDWQYQDQTRALNFGWAMEDADTNIRYSSGRQRREAVKQRDRAVITQNLEGQQIETGRTRQEEVWKKEDERFEKQKTYSETLNRLDTESFELNKAQRIETYAAERANMARKIAEYNEEKAIREEMQTLQRKYQSDQMDLQMAQIGLQAQYAKDQKVINDNIVIAQQGVGKIVGSFTEISKYDNAFNTLNALNYALSSANAIDSNKVAKLGDLFWTIANTSMAQIQAWQKLFEDAN